MEGDDQGGHTYVDHRDDTVTPSPPSGHATVSGLYVMPPPQAKPAQPSAAGAVICRSVSKGGAAASGTAIRKVGVDGPREYSR